MKDIFQGLNNRQAEAVKATEGRIRSYVNPGERDTVSGSSELPE